MIRPRPSTPPTVPPIIADVLLGLSLVPTGANSGVSLEVVKGEVEEDVGTSLFPTVDSGRFASSLAFCALKKSGVTTSMYAHAGTAVAELI